MTTHVDIVAEFDDRSVMVSANDLKRNVERAGDDTGKAWGQGFTRSAEGRLRDDRGRFVKVGQDLGGDVGKGMAEGLDRELPRFKAGMREAASATSEYRAEYKKLQDLMRDGSSWERVAAQSERVAASHNLARTAAREAGDAFSEFQNASRGLSNAAEGTTSTLTQLGAAIGKLSNIAMPVAIVGLGAAAVELAGVAASATQALWLIPAAAGAAGAAIGTIALATYGFGDALKAVGDPQKFAEALQNLSPNAQQAALSIQQLMPVFTQLREATSDAFFANVGPQLNQLANQFLPTIQAMTTGIASAMNQMFSGVAQQLMTPQTQQAIQQFTTNITTAFQNLAPAMAPLVSAFAQIAEAGSGALPGLAAAATKAAQAFSQFISEASATGDLQRWLNEGLDTLGQLVPAAEELAKAFMSLAPMGRELLPDIVTALGSINQIMPAIAFAAVLLGPPFGLWEATIGNIGTKFEAIGGIAQNVGNAVIPVFNRIGEAASDMLAPIRAAAALVGINIPEFSPIAQISSASTGNGTPGVNRTALGGATLPTAGIDPITGLPLPANMGGLGSSLSANRSTDVSGWSGQPIFGSASGGGAGAGSTALPQAPALPYDTSLPAGYANLPQTAEIVGAENSWMDARHAVAEKQARVNQLEKDNTATADDITKAKNDLVNAQQQQQQSELRLQDARQSLYDKANKQLDGYATQMGEIGAKLDQDLGISKGLPGLADNLVRFLGNLALAGPLAQMNALSNAPGQAQGGYGLMGMLGAQGAFGPQYTAAGQAAASSQGSASAMGPAAFGGGMAPGGTYGLPTGTNTGGYGTGTSATFPAWAMALGQAFGVTPSTYSGHQETDRNEAGYAPNPMHENRGIDWSGTPENMQRFADYLATMPQDLEQVIWNGGGAGTGQTVEIAGGRPQPGYFAGDLAGHGNHVHTRQSMPIPLPGGGGGGGLSPQQWNNIAGAEASGNWGINSGNGYSGGLQFDPNTWNQYGGQQYAPQAWQASPQQQMDIGNNVLAGQGPGAWPATSAANPGWFQPGGSGWGGPGLPSTIVGGAGQGPVLGGAGPGVGASAGAAGPQLGAAVEPTSNPQGGGFGITQGGMIDTAVGLAASAFPGLGQAAQTGMKLANRAIQYGGQVAGIATQGALDTFLPWGGSELASKNWLTRLVGAAAGASPALPNMAGKAAAPLSAEQAAQQQGQPGQQGGPVNQGVQIMGDYHQNGTEDKASADLASHLTAQNTRPGP